MGTETTTAVTPPRGKDVRFSARQLIVELADGREVRVPLTWFPRLFLATPQERRNWTFLGPETAVHWPDLDEDISLEGLVVGRRSAEAVSSLATWARAHNKVDRIRKTRWGAGLRLGATSMGELRAQLKDRHSHASTASAGR